jgi:hypothetical protein
MVMFYASVPNMGEDFLQGNLRPRKVAALLQVICERCLNLFDVICCRTLGMGHDMPLDVSVDAYQWPIAGQKRKLGGSQIV